jgi:hypothetical protein
MHGYRTLLYAARLVPEHEYRHWQSLKQTLKQRARDRAKDKAARERQSARESTRPRQNNAAAAAKDGGRGRHEVGAGRKEVEQTEAALIREMEDEMETDLVGTCSKSEFQYKVAAQSA